MLMWTNKHLVGMVTWLLSTNRSCMLPSAYFLTTYDLISCTLLLVSFAVRNLLRHWWRCCSWFLSNSWGSRSISDVAWWEVRSNESSFCVLDKWFWFSSCKGTASSALASVWGKLCTFASDLCSCLTLLLVSLSVIGNTLKLWMKCNKSLVEIWLV